MDPQALQPEDGLLELPQNGSPPLWLWARTCPEAECKCRSAVVLSAGEDRQELVRASAPVHEAWRAGQGFRQIAGALGPRVFAFDLDIDTAEVAPLAGVSFESLGRDARVTALLERMDGDALDALGRFWYRAKGWPDPEGQRARAARIEIARWSPGDMLAWNELMTGVRQDFYAEGRRLVEAVDLYCIKPGCTCGEVVIAFEPMAPPRGQPSPGRVILRASMEPELVSRKAHAERLTELWARFCRRHPRHLERLARRGSIMKEAGGRVVALARPPPAAATPPRNAPCPCGSGKKYKRCCGL